MMFPLLAWASASLVPEFLPVSFSADYPTEGLVFHWRMDEWSGTTVEDETGNGFTGQLLGFPDEDSHWIDGHLGGGLWMEPGVTGPHVSEMTVAVDGLPLMQSTTWSVWVRLDGNPNSHGAVVSAVFPGANHGHNLGFHHDITVRNPRILWNHGISQVTLLSPEPVNRKWNHLALTYDAGTTTLRLYVNGSLKAESDSAGGAAFDSINLGRRGNRQFAFRGGIDEVLVYDRALNPGEIQVLAQAGMGGHPEILSGPVSAVVRVG